MSKEKYIVVNKNGFQVQLWLDGKLHYIGLYKTLEKAILERDKAINNLGIIPKYNNIYFDNKIAYYEIVVSKAEGSLSPKLFKMLCKIVKGVSKKFKYSDEEDRWDCEAYAYEVIIKNWREFDEEKYNNVLAYFTECVKRAFAMQFKILQKTRLKTISLDYTFDNGKSIQNYI
jgi:hypothetical protein